VQLRTSLSGKQGPEAISRGDKPERGGAAESGKKAHKEKASQINGKKRVLVVHARVFVIFPILF